MTPSTAAFMTHLIDYAGIFPPAALSLEEAVSRYASYLKDADAWMLGRFVCFAAQLSQLGPYLDLFSESRPLRISALAPKNATTENLVGQLEAIQREMERFNTEWGGRGCVDAVEVALPEGLPGAACVRGCFQNALPTFLEIPYNASFEENLPGVLDSLAQEKLGFKLRTGGVVTPAFPTCAQVASAIVGCRERGIPMKCTAGLHHPLRRYDASVQTKMHGFMNVFGAGILAHAHSLKAETVQRIVEDSDASHFAFDMDGLGWQDLKANTEQISRVRREAMISFGSCSFDEPLAEMRALDWL